MARKQYDWEAIEREYRMGQMTLRDLSAKFGPAYAVIGRRAKKDRWVRDKSAEVARRTKAALAAEDSKPKGHKKRGHKKSDEKVTRPTQIDIETAVQTRVEVVKSHRATIKNGQEQVNMLFKQLKDAIEKRDEIEETIIIDTESSEGDSATEKRNKEARRKAMLKAVSIPSHAGVMKDLSTAIKYLIPLERQAFSLDDGGALPVDEIFTVLEKINPELARLVKEKVQNA